MIPFYQVSISLLLEDTDPILPNFNLVSFDRYCFHIQDFPKCFMLFDRSWFHIQDFQELLERIAGLFRRPFFLRKSNFPMSKLLRFPNISQTNDLGFVRRLFAVILVPPIIDNIGLGSHGHIWKSQEHVKKVFFPRMESKIY